MRPGYEELVAERGRGIADRIVESAERYSDNAHRPWNEALDWAIDLHDRPVDLDLVAQQEENARRHHDLVERRGDESRPISYLASALGGDAFDAPARLARAEAIYDATPSIGPDASMREQLDWAAAAARAERHGSS